jgi:hypothetical protein
MIAKYTPPTRRLNIAKPMMPGQQRGHQHHQRQVSGRLLKGFHSAAAR